MMCLRPSPLDALMSSPKPAVGAAGQSPLQASLDHLCLGSPAPEELARFYARALGLSLTSTDGGWWGEGPQRRLHFVVGAKKSLGYAAYRVASAESLDALRQRLFEAGATILPSPSPRFPRGLCVRDPDGNHLVFDFAPETEAVSGPGQVRSAHLQHFVVASRNAPQISSFFQHVLGFQLSDNVVDEHGAVRTSFLRCSEEHHSFAVFQAPENRLDHHCYEANDWNAIRDWGDSMAGERIPIVWGPGRHGPGNNLFLFIHDSDGNWVEISAELEHVATDRPAGVWPHEERTLNTWGRGFLRS
jgi:catechol 2,3-dioxygenase-like lactoylglutathione lyase family enzyme